MSVLQRKDIIPKLNLTKISQANHPLSSRETCHLLNSHRELDSQRAKSFDKSTTFKSKRPGLWTSEMFTSRKNKTFEEYQEEIHEKVWNEQEEELCELTLKLDELQKELSFGHCTFEDAGIQLSKIRAQHHHHHNDDDLIFCLDLVEQLWECVNSDGLSCTEFSNLLSNMLGRPKSEFDVLFQKMDADGDETLSWGEYVSFLTQQQAHLWQHQESKNVCYQESASNVFKCNMGNYMFHKICIMNGDKTSKCTLSGAKYAMLASDNSIQIRNAMSLQFESSIDLCLRPKKIEKTEKKKNSIFQSKYAFNSKKLRKRASQSDVAKKVKESIQFTNICTVQDKDDGMVRLAVAFMDRAVNIYLPSFTAPKNMLPIYLQSPIDRKRYKNKLHYHLEHGFYALDIPQCMQSFDDSLLLIGETYGTIALYNYTDKNCLVRVKKHGMNTTGPCVVKQVCHSRIGIFSCAMDNDIILTDPTKWNTVRTLSGHSRGAYSLAASTKHRMIVSAGYDRKVFVWDPYVKNPIGSLKGHVSPVVGVLCSDNTNQIITASVDKKIKIWDVRTWKLLQTIRDSSIHQPFNQLTAINYDPQQSCLITAGSKVRKWYAQNSNCTQSQNKEGKKENYKMAAIVSICYSNIFKQLISIHVDQTCILWDVESGQNVFEFKLDHHRDSITTASIDEIGKRLLTATQNGVIKMWNFSNGAVMHVFEQIEFEITKLIYLPRTLHCVVCCGFDADIIRFPSHLAPNEANFILKNKCHKSDVRAICELDEYFLSGSSDGKIAEWHIDSNVKTQVFECPDMSISITTMNACKLKGSWHLFVGTEDGMIHLFEKRLLFEYVLSFDEEQYLFKEPILEIVVNDDCDRLMIADCNVSMKLFDIQNLHNREHRDIILMKEWMPHNNDHITSLLYLPHFNVFASSSDSGELVLWNMDGINLGQFGQAEAWNLFSSSSLMKKKCKKIKENADDSNNEDEESANLPKLSSRRSYFDDHEVYQPKCIRSVLSESIARTLLEDHTEEKKECKRDKSKFEQSMDKLIGDLMKPKKRKRCSRRSTLYKGRKSTMHNRMKISSLSST